VNKIETKLKHKYLELVGRSALHCCNTAISQYCPLQWCVIPRSLNNYLSLRSLLL